MPSNLPRATTANPASAYEIGQVVRSVIGIAAFCMTFMIVVALIRAGLGMVENLHYYAKVPLIIHVAAVLPTVPLGAYILLTRKGTPRHKLLGKIWLILMLITATSAIFIKTTGSFSWIHIFVPLTFHAAWKTVATARRGDISAHKWHLVLTYMAALMIPGFVAFLAPGRLMNVMLFG